MSWGWEKTHYTRLPYVVVCVVLISRNTQQVPILPQLIVSPLRSSTIEVAVPDPYIATENCYILGVSLSLTSQALATSLAGKKVFLTRYIRSQNPPAELLEESQYKMVGWQ